MVWMPGWQLVACTREEAGQEQLDRLAMELFAILQRREADFGIHPDVTIEIPDPNDRGADALLVDPVGHIEARISLLERQIGPVSRVVVLTTFGDRLWMPLVAAGYRATKIDMPAGPDFTCWFERKLPADEGRTLYLEAVDEADAKIRPGFAFRLLDEGGRLRGGACGSIHQRDGKEYCYLATMVLDAGLPHGTGQWLGEELLAFLRRQGVSKVHLGTQTAAPFYQKLGFRVVQRLIADLRLRHVDGRTVSTDLVMMERAL